MDPAAIGQGDRSGAESSVHRSMYMCARRRRLIRSFPGTMPRGCVVPGIPHVRIPSGNRPSIRSQAPAAARHPHGRLPAGNDSSSGGSRPGHDGPVIPLPHDDGVMQGSACSDGTGDSTCRRPLHRDVVMRSGRSGRGRTVPGECRLRPLRSTNPGRRIPSACQAQPDGRGSHSEMNRVCPKISSLSGAHSRTSPSHGSIRVPDDDGPDSRPGSEARHRKEKCTDSAR